MSDDDEEEDDRVNDDDDNEIDIVYRDGSYRVGYIILLVSHSMARMVLEFKLLRNKQ